MTFTKIKEFIQRKLTIGEEGSFFPNIRSYQVALLFGGLILILFSIGFFLLSSEPTGQTDKDSSRAEKKVTKKDVTEMTTPLQAVKPEEIWVNRVERQVEEAKEESKQVRQENEFLQKKVDVLESLFTKPERGPLRIDPSQGGLVAAPSLDTSTPQPQQFPLPGSVVEAGSAFQGHSDTGEVDSFGGENKKKRRKLVRLTGGGLSGGVYKTKETYMPAGTYSKAVILSGVVASTATNAQGNPQPIMLRLVDNGNMPRGFKGKVKDAVIVGSCYGDISSERAFCRLETISWVEGDGRTVEKTVEGWVYGEDGRAGLRGEVIDRSSDVAREGFGAGLLSAAANFFKMESQRSVYPVSPFGQTNPLSNKDALAGAGAAGVGGALDRLAEFSIKRAEQMQPVILISSGRVVDIAFKSGVDLSPDSQEPMKIVGSKNESQETGEN